MGDNLDFALPTDIAELTPAYLTTALRHGGHLANGEVSSVDASPLGAGVGFVGQLARLKLAYEGDCGGLPDVMIAKFPIEDPVAKYIAKMYGFYRAEAECYRQAATIGLGVPTPDVFLSEVSDDDDGTLILMEDLGEARMADQVTGASLADAEAVIDAGARLHAAWWQSPRLDELGWLRPLNNPAYMAVGDQYNQSWPVFAEMFASAPAAALEVGERIGAQLPFAYDWLMANRPTTLAHTDFRLDNFFFDRPGAPVTVIDWQLSVRSLGAFDIGYFIVQSLTAEMRREHGETLLRRWHQGLVDLGVTDYSWDDAQADFHDSVMLQMSIPVIAAANLDPANERGKQLLDCLGHRSCQALADYGCTGLRIG
jgi:Phosphotransferase enzyme family